MSHEAVSHGDLLVFKAAYKTCLSRKCPRNYGLAHFDVDLPNNLLVTLLISEPDQQNQALIRDQLCGICHSEDLRELIFLPLHVSIDSSLMIQAVLEAGHE